MEPRRERILVVDDEEVVRRLLEKSLTAEGYHVATARDGEEGFNTALEENPNLVLLDLMMPRFDGYEFLRRRRAEPSLRDTPVVVLTAYGGEPQLVRAIDAGADDFLVKPLSLAELTARIRARLRDRRTVADLQGQRRDQELLLQLSTALASQLDVRQILFTVASRLADMVQVDRVSFVIVSRDLEHGYVMAASEDPNAHNIRVRLADYPEILEVVSTRQILVVPDVASHPLLTDVRDAIAATETRSLMLFPLAAADEVIGVLFLRARSPWQNGLTPREEGICGIVANASAVALRTAQVLQSIRGDTARVRRERVQTERRLQSLKRYEQFCENISDGMATFDEEGLLLFLNRAGEQILGLERAQTVGRTLPDLVAPDDREIAQALVRDGADRERAVDLRTLAGRVLSVSVSALAGEYGAVVLSFRDVTEDRHLHDDLRATKDFLESLVRQSVDAIVAADESGAILLWNQGAVELLGYSEEEAKATLRLADLFSKDDLEAVTRLLHSSEFGGAGRLSPVRREVLTRDRAIVPVRLGAAIVEDAEGRSRLVVLLSDLRRQVEMENRLARAQAKLAETEKQALVLELAGTAAHELNQPLTSLLGLCEVLRREMGEAHQHQETVDGIGREAERIAEVVRKLGNLSSYETKDYVGAARIVDLDRSSGDD